MSIVQVAHGRPDPATIGRPMVKTLSAASADISSLLLARRLESFASPTPTFAGRPLVEEKNLREKLFDSLAAFKIRTASVAMHLDRAWRDRLFAQLDSLLDAESWEADDLPPTINSFSTFLRMILLLRPDRRPGIGAAADGSLIAMWTAVGDRLTIECLSGDLVRWYLSVSIDGENERAAGLTPLGRLGAVLSPYGPDRWFAAHGNDLHPG